MSYLVVHIGIGNIFDSSLKEFENGFRVRILENIAKNVWREDKEFIKNYMAKDGILFLIL